MTALEYSDSEHSRPKSRVQGRSQTGRQGFVVAAWGFGYDAVELTVLKDEDFNKVPFL